MQHQSFEALRQSIAHLEHELEVTKREARTAAHEVVVAKRRVDVLATQSKALQTVSLGIFSMLDPLEIYRLASESLVIQLGWSSAFVVAVRGSRSVVLASAGATQQQLHRIQDHLATTPSFTEAYSQRTTVATYKSHDGTSLALRSLFVTDEVVATPIQQGDHLFAYLVACDHTVKGSHQHLHDLDFLAAFSAQIAHAVQNSTSFRDLESQNIRLRQLDDLKDQFISVTSHQLRTPLSIVKWILSILQTDNEVAKLAEQHKLIAQAYESNERLIHVVNDLLNASRIQDGKLPYTPQRMDVNGVVADVVSNSKTLAENKQLTLSCSTPDHAVQADLDPILFREAIQNLVDNAIDYNIVGGSVKLAVVKHADDVRIDITNTGMGISEETQAKIFDQFYRSPEAVRLQPNGNGLGLYLVRAIVTAHGGEILCSSVLNKETTFSIVIPIARGDRG